MIENKLRFFFKRQIWHIGGLIVLYYVALQLVNFETDSNVFLGISTKSWFLFSMMTPLPHQGYVWYAGGRNYVGKQLAEPLASKVTF